MEEYHVVSFSGGKDSTAMLLRMLELNMRVDEIIFCDTTVEFPQIYKHIKEVEKYINRKITTLRGKYSFEDLLLNHSKGGKFKDVIGHGFPLVNVRWCTSKLKTEVIEKYLNSFRKRGVKVIQYIGIAADEGKRVKDKNYPLVDWGWKEEDCLKYCYEKGFTWGGAL